MPWWSYFSSSRRMGIVGVSSPVADRSTQGIEVVECLVELSLSL